jgi:hypothetical protein
MEKAMSNIFLQNVLIVSDMKQKGLDPIFGSDLHVNCIPVCDDCLHTGELIGCSQYGQWSFCSNCRTKSCKTDIVITQI